MNAANLTLVEDVLKALADGTRLRILSLLRAGEVCVCNIHESLRLPQAKVSRHLAYLRHAGLVGTRRDGLWVHYRLATWADPSIQQLVDSAVHAVTHLEVSGRDLQRLGKRTELPRIERGDTGTFACCAPKPLESTGQVK